MAPSRNSSRLPSTLPISPELRYLRAIRYWHQHGKFIHDQPGFDQATCTIKKPRKPRPKPIPYQDPLIPHPHTPIPSALAHTYTSTHSPKYTSTHMNTVKEATVVNLRQEDPNFYGFGSESPSDGGSDSTTERPYWMGGLATELRGERETLGITPQDYGKRWVSGYRYRLGPTPDCGPGDHDKAQFYWYKIREALDDENERWTPNERTRLRAMELKWQKRKDGQDPRFEMVGNRVGGLDEVQRRELHDRRILEDIASLVRTHWRAVRDRDE